MISAKMIGTMLKFTVPEGGSAWLYLLLASAVCAGALAWSARSRARRDDIR